MRSNPSQVEVAACFCKLDTFKLLQQLKKTSRRCNFQTLPNLIVPLDFTYLTTLPLIIPYRTYPPSPPAEVTNIVVTSEVATQVIFGCPSICMNLMGTSQVFFFKKNRSGSVNGFVSAARCMQPCWNIFLP